MEEKKKQKSHEGAAQIAAPAVSAAVPVSSVTERNVQLHTATHTIPIVGGTSQASSVLSSRERTRRYEIARAAYEMAQARHAMLAAEHDVSAGSRSHTGSVGRRLDDVQSDTGSSGPSLRIRETVQENPFAGVFSSPPYYDHCYSYSDHL
jgi:hypothetical protein